jgi:hypothetical protein
MSELTLGQLRELAKKHGKEYGREFVIWALENGIFKQPSEVEEIKNKDLYSKAGCKNSKEYQDKNAQKLGYESNSERVRMGRWNKGLHSPMSENDECSSYFGVYIAENYISKLFEDPIVAPYGTQGYDWICRKGKKIELKSRCLQQQGKRIGWNFTGIDYNNIADYFILSGWKDRESLLPLFAWMFHRKDIIRGREFWDRESFYITNRPEYLREFKRYELKDKLYKLKELCDKLKEE